MTKNKKQQPNKQQDAVEIFLGVQRNRAGVDEWENYKAFVEQSPTHAAEQKDIEQLWCDAGNLPDGLMPSAEELAADTYDGEETVESFLQGHDHAVPRRSKAFWQTVMSAFKSLWSGSVVRPAFAAAALMFVVGTVFMWPGDAALNYNTGIGEHRRVALDDGSYITLGAKSEVHINYQTTERSVALVSGEAFFEVAKDKARPFVVDVNGLAVQAVGTAFSILNTPENVFVSVTEGIVRVDTSEAEDVGNDQVAMLEIGDALNVTKATNSFAQTEEDPSRMLFWQNDILYFRGEQLKDIFYRIDRYTEKNIVFTEPMVGELSFSGSINRHNIDGWLNSLPLAFPVKIDRQADKIVIAYSAS